MPIQKHIPLVTLVAGLAVTATSSTFAQNSVIRWHNLSGGLGIASGDNSRVVAVLGQPFAGRSVTVNSVLESGFLVHPSANGHVVSAKDVEEIPLIFALHQNYPNPFNPVTKIRFEIPIARLVTLKVYNILGQEIATLVNEEMRPGSHEVLWDASRMASGVYFYRLQANDIIQTNKMILVR